MPITQVLWLFSVSFAAAVLALAGFLLFGRGKVRPGLFTDPQAGTLFLFDGEVLLDASPAARALLASARMPGSAWQRFLAWAAPRFPGVERQLDALADQGRIRLVSPGAEGLTLVAEWRSGIRRIALYEPHVDSRGSMIDSLTLRAQEDELDSLRELTDAAPLPIWREDAEGQVIWGNQAYVGLAMACAGGSPLAWPLPGVIAIAESGRTFVTLPDGGGNQWFDCHVVPLDDGRIVYALPADAAVQAEKALGNFVQTLTKTFAQLPTGLAIFDRKRRLQLFNPALTDLTGLSPEFLSSRPGLFNLLDAMRESGMIPEPRDYKAWRAQLAAMEKSASDGHYEETWALPSGRTYRVTGRPHPEGALALLVQDISDEMTRARRMRADLELGQSVIDATDEAIAVVSSAGQLVIANSAYARFWGHDPSEAMEEQSLDALVEGWRQACAPSRFWSLVPAYAANSIGRIRQSAVLRLNDGRRLTCRLAPLAGGATLVGFSPEPAPGDGAVRLIELSATDATVPEPVDVAAGASAVRRHSANGGG